MITNLAEAQASLDYHKSCYPHYVEDFDIRVEATEERRLLLLIFKSSTTSFEPYKIALPLSEEDLEVDIATAYEDAVWANTPVEDTEESTVDFEETE